MSLHHIQEHGQTCDGIYLKFLSTSSKFSVMLATLFVIDPGIVTFLDTNDIQPSFVGSPSVN